jgi:hypothetical protein
MPRVTIMVGAVIIARFEAGRLFSCAQTHQGLAVILK